MKYAIQPHLRELCDLFTYRGWDKLGEEEFVEHLHRQPSAALLLNVYQLIKAEMGESHEHTESS